MNTVLIHFWLLQSSFKDDVLKSYWQEMLGKTLLQCKDDTKSLILDVTPELIDMETQIENLQNFIDQVKRDRPRLKIFLIFNKTMVRDINLKFDKADDILYLEDLLIPYYSMISKKTSYFNPSWNPNNDKLLFLIRRPFGQHRIGLLRRLINQGLREELKWSLTDVTGAKNHFLLEPNEYIRRCSLFLPGMSTEEVQEFIEKNSKMFGDTVCPTIGDLSQMATDPSLTNSKQTITEMYSSVLGEIVSESHFNISYPTFLTEKPFKAIANMMPFIVVGQEKTEECLESMGFYTFNVDDTASTMNNQTIIEILNDGTDPSIFFQTSYHVDRFPKFYEEFKDSSWPTEVHWNDLGSLPFNIQAEIIENFFSIEEIRWTLRLQTTINRIKSFKKSLLKNKEKIKMMTEHNFNNFLTLGEKYVTDIKGFLTKNNIDLDYLNFLELLYKKPADHDVYLQGALHNDYSN